MPGVAEPIDDVQFLLTASEAYVALERAFLEAETEISAGFRIFDPATPLYSKEGRAVGADWFDLVVHTLRRGVRLSLVLTDFDPVAVGSMHRATWRSMRLLIAAAEVAGRPDLLRCRAHLHPAEVGALPRWLLAIKSRRLVREQISALNALPPGEQDRAWSEKPGLHPLATKAGGVVTMNALLVPPLRPVTHHQKIAVFDRKRLYVGGLDLSARRYDTPDHSQPPRQTWHDTQLLISGPVAQAAKDHLDGFLDVVAGRRDPQPAPGLLRTLSQRRRLNIARLSPHPLLDELLAAHLEQVRRARGLIYLETQFFRDRLMARALTRAAAANPDLGLILVLPAAPEAVAFEDKYGRDQQYGEHLQARYLGRVMRAFGSRCFIGTPALPQKGGSGRAATHDAPLIYVHAKLSVFDDTAALVSSANLNGRSFRWDTEVGVMLDRAEDVAQIRRRCFEHWLPEGAAEAFFDPATAVAAWRELARENAGRDPAKRDGFILPYSLAPARRFGRNLPGIPEDIV